MTAEEIKIARAITAQMGKVLCPVCSDLEDESSPLKQELAAYGNFEETMFCPHCDLDVNIIVRCHKTPE